MEERCWPGWAPFVGFVPPSSCLTACPSPVPVAVGSSLGLPPPSYFITKVSVCCSCRNRPSRASDVCIASLILAALAGPVVLKWGQFCPLGDLWQCLEALLIAMIGGVVLLAPSVWRSRMLLNILQCTGRPHGKEWLGPKYQ